MSHPPAEFPFWVILSVCTAPHWVAHNNKSSHRHAICCGIVGLALALGGFLISLQHFFHTPNLFQLPLKTTLHAAHPHMCISTLVPEGVLCTIGMSMCSTVFSFTQSTPCAPCQFTKSLHMHTGLSATLPWLVHHYVPTIHPVHQHFSIFPHPGTATHVLN